MKNVPDKHCRENQNTHFIFNNIFSFQKSCRLLDNVKKCCRGGPAADDNKAHAHCIAGCLRLQTHCRKM